MNQDLCVPYELALLAKEKGFDEPCDAVYETNKHYDPPEVTFLGTQTPWNLEQMNKAVEWMEKHNRPNFFNGETRNSLLAQFLTAAPTYQQLTEWFRSKHNYSIEVIYILDTQVFFSIIYPMYPRTQVRFTGESFKSHRDALNKGIEESFKLIEL